MCPFLQVVVSSISICALLSTGAKTSDTWIWDNSKNVKESVYKVVTVFWSSVFYLLLSFSKQILIKASFVHPFISILWLFFQQKRLKSDEKWIWLSGTICQISDCFVFRNIFCWQGSVAFFTWECACLTFLCWTEEKMLFKGC